MVEPGFELERFDSSNHVYIYMATKVILLPLINPGQPLRRFRAASAGWE